MNKGTKIGEAEDFGGDPSKCCEKCFGVAPLTNAGIFYIYRCVCFQVTGGFYTYPPLIIMKEKIFQPVSNSSSFHQRLSGIMVKTITNTILTGSVFTFRWDHYFDNYDY